MNSVRIYKTIKGKWCLSIVCNVGTSEQFIRRIEFKTLIKAIELAQTLKVHIDNIGELPINQYKNWR